MMLKHKRYDIRVLRLAGFRLEVYWRADDRGCGPCMSLYVGAREKLRFDLFDPPHMHRANVHGAPRQHYPGNLSMGELAKLACADLVRFYPQTTRGAGWAAEQLAQVAGPAQPIAPGRSPATSKKSLRHGARRAPPAAN